MAERNITISIIGCLNNAFDDYQQKMRTMRQLLESVKEDIEDEIKEYLYDGWNDMSTDEVLDDFFDEKHGMMAIGRLLARDLRHAKFGDFDKMEILQAKTDEAKAQLKQLTDMLN